MFASLAVKLYLTYRVTLATFLGMPCYVDGKPQVCSTAPGSFNRAMLDADDCGGQWAVDTRDGAPFYYADCPQYYRESDLCVRASVARGGSPDLDCEIWEND